MERRAFLKSAAAPAAVLAFSPVSRIRSAPWSAGAHELQSDRVVLSGDGLSLYVSLYKYFNAPFGAILAGPAALLERVAVLRHQFGSLLYHGWESAAVAVRYLEGFTERYQAAVRNGEALLRLLEADGRLRIERIPPATNVFGLGLASGAALDGLRFNRRSAVLTIPSTATSAPHSIPTCRRPGIPRRSCGAAVRRIFRKILLDTSPAVR